MNTKQQVIIHMVTNQEELSSLLINACINHVIPKLNQFKKIPLDEDIDEELLTIKQVADYFQVSTTTIHNWKATGVLTYIKMKSRIRFKKSTILAFEEKRRKKNKY